MIGLFARYKCNGDFPGYFFSFHHSNSYQRYGSSATNNGKVTTPHNSTKLSKVPQHTHAGGGQNPGCKGKSEVLEVHHLGYWKGDRSDRPGNLITLCEKCHTPKNHLKEGFLYGWQPDVKSFKPETFMSTVRWRIVNELGCEHAYGFQTKSRRIALGMDKSLHNDAFVIANGSRQPQIQPVNLEQIRRNNRSLEMFYDAQYMDLRTGKKASGQALGSGRRVRNKELNGENLRIYRGHKLSAGRKQIRRQRYSWQPGDLVRYDGRVHRVQAMQNKGAYVKLAEKRLPVRSDKVKPVCWRKGICGLWNSKE
jgi:hypothetical protein